MFEITFLNCDSDCCKDCTHHLATTCEDTRPVLAVFVDFTEDPNLADLYLDRLPAMSLYIEDVLLSSVGIGSVESL